MDNKEKLQFAAKQISELIRLEAAWRDGRIKIESLTIDFDEVFETKLKQKFAAIRNKTIDALNAITP